MRRIKDGIERLAPAPSTAFHIVDAPLAIMSSILASPLRRTSSTHSRRVTCTLVAALLSLGATSGCAPRRAPTSGEAHASQAVVVTSDSAHCAPVVSTVPAAPANMVVPDGPLPTDGWAAPLCTRQEADAALIAFRSLDARLKEARPTEDATAPRAALAALLAGPCFAMAQREAPDGFVFDSMLSLATWWKAGGREWLRGYPSLPNDGDRMAHEVGWDLWIPPSVPRALTLDTQPSGPMIPLLCAVTDGHCGAETAGWLVRAADFMRHRRQSWLSEHDAKDEKECID